MIAVILGPDRRLAREHLAAIRLELDPIGDNTDQLDGRQISIESAIAAVAAGSFFGGARVVVIEELLSRMGKSKGDPSTGDGEATASSGSIDLSRLVAAVAPGNHLVLVDRGLGTVPATAKAALPRDARIEVGEPLRGTGLIRWMGEQARTSGSSCSEQVARQLASTLYPQHWSAKPSNPAYDRPPDMDAIANEIEKLACASAPGPITVETIRELTAAASDDRLFAFVDAVLGDQHGIAARQLDSLVSAGEEPSRLANQLMTQVELIGLVAAARPGASVDAIGREAGIASVGRMKAVDDGRRRLRRPVADWLQRALDVDYGIKRGRIRSGWDGVYALIGDAGHGNDKRTGR